MAKQTQFVLEGTEQFRRSLDRAVEDIEAPLGAHHAAARVIAAAAKSRAPRDTGKMKNAHVATASETQAIVMVQTRYSGYVHSGTGKMPARPWLLEAGRATESTWTKIYEVAARRALERVRGV